MVLHILSNHLTASHTSSVNSGLTLTEDNDRLQDSTFLDDTLLNNLLCRTRLASSELSLQVSNSTSISSNLTILGIVVSTQLIDLSIQAINLSLVAKLSNLEVVSTVRVTELIVETYACSKQRTIDVEFSLRMLVVSNVVNQSGLNIYLPLLVRTEVQSQVKTELCYQSIIL